ncbi:BCAN [Branchiostoma lanceolatum]|uniref:BCAN protein n=1 Tax=Branchiostoma lanceolatum TaxID=7740 RepID=A0A8J9VYV8_BRALA|nr:BCAN [Branchiostoma lanceolatum]
MWKACLSPPVARGILAVLFALFVSGSDSLTVTVDSESPTTLISGEDGYLVCTFTPASPTFILTWRRETYTVYTKLQVMGSVLTSIAYGSLRGRAEIVDDVTLKIKGVEKSDAATYECEVSDMSGSDSGESSAFVEVFVVDNPSPPECSVSADNLVEGTNASLSCSSTSGRESSLQWYQQLSNGSFLEVGNKTADWSKLTYDLNVTKQDGGAVYVCLEEHPEPIKSRNCSVTLDISYVDTPVINATSPLAIQEGNPLVMECDVDSRPVADVMWVLPSGESRQGAHLELPAAERRHEGVYSCVANITAGGVQLITGATVEVTVIDETTAMGVNVTGTPATSKPNGHADTCIGHDYWFRNTVTDQPYGAWHTLINSDNGQHQYKLEHIKATAYHDFYLRPIATNVTHECPSLTLQGDKCLKDYVLHDGSCFKAFSKAVTYSEAEATCAAEGGIVAPTKTEEHQRLIRKLVYSVKPLANFWIGLDDRREEGVWRWSDGTVLRAEDFQTWVPGEPNNYQGTQHCGRYWASMEQWDDVVCYVRYLFVCQIGQPSANTQSYTPANVVQTSAVRITRSPNKGTTRPTPLQNDEEEREAEKEDITMANSSYVHNKTTLQLNQVGRPSVKESLPGWKVSLIIIFTIVGLAILALLVAFFLRSKFFRFKRSIMPVAEPQSTQEYGSKTKLDP